jgi:hypothetical protein
MWIFLELICETEDSYLKFSVIHIADVTEELYEYINYIQRIFGDYYADTDQSGIETLLNSGDCNFELKSIKKCVMLEKEQLHVFQQIFDFNIEYKSHLHIDALNLFEIHQYYISALKYLQSFRGDIESELYHLCCDKIEGCFDNRTLDILKGLINYLEDWNMWIKLKSLRSKIIPDLKNLINSYLGNFTYFTIQNNQEIVKMIKNVQINYDTSTEQFLIHFQFNFLDCIEISSVAMQNIDCLSHIVKYMRSNNLKIAYFTKISD